MFYSERWKDMLGCSGSEVTPSIEEWLSRIHPEDRLRVDADLKAHLDGTSAHFENEHRMLHRDGTFRWMLSRGLAIRNSEGAPTRIAGSLTDITAGKVADPLTGLANRVLFVDRLSRLAERAQRHKDFLFAVLFLDLDRFKLINDSFGHCFGDQALIAFARRIERSLRMSDTISRLAEGTLARIGGDEFTVLLDGLRAPEDAEKVAERLIDALKEPFQIGDHEIYLSVSIGVALSSTAFDSPEDLLRDADTAMYRAKSLSQRRVEVFDQNMRESAVARLRLENDLRHGIEREEMSNAYQLIVSLETGKARGFEALVRWQHPSRGIVPPSEFIPVAEDTGLILPIGQFVLKEACRQIRVWHNLRPVAGNLVMAVNLSVREFMQDDFVEQVKRTLQSTGVDPGSVELEITESMVMDNPESARRTLGQLKNLGVRIGMDDFGTGYSSLSYLHKFPLDILKIDQSFVNGMEYDPDKYEIVKTIISLAHNLKLQVTAEGVETGQQMRLLAELGCDCAQGYWISRPLSPAAASDLLLTCKDWSGFTERQESLVMA
jgi:diguanylate cyclase (GGDEF)-like protein/PAS domain S-box-containing protein